jgi:hypothetical protein
MRRKTLPALTLSGLPGIQEIPWGSHFCQFYRGHGELMESLAHYFRAGIRNQERCLWFTSGTRSGIEAHGALLEAMPEVEASIKSGAIRVVRRNASVPSSAELIVEERKAVADGHHGLRIAGNPCSLTKARSVSRRHEEKFSAVMASRRIVALCSYDLGKCAPTEIFEVILHHGFAIEREDGHWTVYQR